MKRMDLFLEMRDSSMSFTPILPKTSQHTIHKVYGQELLPGLHLPGSMHSQEHQGCIRLN